MTHQRASPCKDHWVGWFGEQLTYIGSQLTVIGSRWAGIGYSLRWTMHKQCCLGADKPGISTTCNDKHVQVSPKLETDRSILRNLRTVQSWFKFVLCVVISFLVVQGAG